MKLHYMGRYDLNPDSLPHGEHLPGAVPFQEAEDSKALARIANAGCTLLMLLLAIPAYFRCRAYFAPLDLLLGCAATMLIVFPHELLHAVCFREDVYLYTNWKQGMVFVVGPESMSKARFIFMSLLPNLVFGLLPYALGLIFPRLTFCAVLGTFALGMGFGDYYNVFNAATQMPKGARTYLYGFHSFWYRPQ